MIRDKLMFALQDGHIDKEESEEFINHSFDDVIEYAERLEADKARLEKLVQSQGIEVQTAINERNAAWFAAEELEADNKQLLARVAELEAQEEDVFSRECFNCDEPMADDDTGHGDLHCRKCR